MAGQRFIARPSLPRILLLTLAAIGFVVLGAWIAGLLGPPARPGREWVGWLSIIFFGLCALVGVVRLFDRGDVIVIDHNGLFWRPGSRGTIPWMAIQAIESRVVRRNCFLCIHLQDAAQFPARGPAGWVDAANRRFGFGDIAISTSGTNRSHNELMAAIRHFAPADLLYE